MDRKQVKYKYKSLPFQFWTSLIKILSMTTWDLWDGWLGQQVSQRYTGEEGGEDASRSQGLGSIWRAGHQLNPLHTSAAGYVLSLPMTEKIHCISFDNVSSGGVVISCVTQVLGLGLEGVKYKMTWGQKLGVSGRSLELLYLSPCWVYFLMIELMCYLP